MVHATGRYRNGTVELDQPLAIAEGTPIELDVYLSEASPEAEAETWSGIGMSRLEEEWDNPADAIYDDWKTLYGV